MGQAPEHSSPRPWTAPPHPYIYEINSWPWLARIAAEEGHPVTLGTVPDRHWDAIAEMGVDAVWLMGVWERSPAGLAIALRNPDLVAEFEAALPRCQPDDVVGSAYCIRDYTGDVRLGGPVGLRAARDALANRGMGLILDFVPNHVAPDHPWTAEHPERFIRGTPEDLTADPASFVEVEGRVYARGRDPYFPAWQDVVQLNAFSPKLRAAAIDGLRAIAEQCDGVRCDMAMLLMNDVFERTWGDRAGPRPAEEYWETVIPAIRQVRPGFMFIAEAFWDLEWALQQQGFDFCYDKRLYDRLAHDDAEQVRLHLLADDAYQTKLLRFIENHDEPRAAAVFDPARERAVALTTLTQTGARLVHDGQLEGRTVRLPVFLGRSPDEPAHTDLLDFYQTLMAALRDPTFRNGTWRLCERFGWPGNDSADNVVAWCSEGDRRWLIVVNLSGETAWAHVRAPWDDLRGEDWRLQDPTTGATFVRSGDDLRDGLYVELGPWSWHLLRIEPEKEDA